MLLLFNIDSCFNFNVFIYRNKYSTMTFIKRIKPTNHNITNHIKRIPVIINCALYWYEIYEFT